MPKRQMTAEEMNARGLVEYEGGWTCNSCPSSPRKKFRDYRAANNHYAKAHSPATRKQCPDCVHECHRNHLQSHKESMHVQEDGKIPCKGCGRAWYHSKGQGYHEQACPRPEGLNSNLKEGWTYDEKRNRTVRVANVIYLEALPCRFAALTDTHWGVDTCQDLGESDRQKRERSPPFVPVARSSDPSDWSDPSLREPKPDDRERDNPKDAHTGGPRQRKRTKDSPPPGAPHGSTRMRSAQAAPPDHDNDDDRDDLFGQFTSGGDFSSGSLSKRLSSFHLSPRQLYRYSDLL